MCMLGSAPPAAMVTLPSSLLSSSPLRTCDLVHLCAIAVAQVAAMTDANSLLSPAPTGRHTSNQVGSSGGSSGIGGSGTSGGGGVDDGGRRSSGGSSSTDGGSSGGGPNAYNMYIYRT